MTHATKLLLPTFALAAMLAYIGPELLDRASEYDSAAQAAHEQYLAGQANKRKRKAAAEMCGNGNAVWLDDTTLACKVRAKN